MKFTLLLDWCVNLALDAVALCLLSQGDCSFEEHRLIEAIGFPAKPVDIIGDLRVAFEHVALEERHECLEVSLYPLGMLEEQLEDVAL